MSRVLVLNADAQPLSILPISTLDWQEAVKVYFLGRVTILENYDDRVIRSPSFEMQIPSIIILNDYVKISKAVRFSRYNLFLRDSFKCQYCEKNFDGMHHDLTLDHVVPRSHGGKTVWDNSVAACTSCNTRKANHSHMKPKSRPYKPTYYELADKRRQFPVIIPKLSWNDYLQWPEESITISN